MKRFQIIILAFLSTVNSFSQENKNKERYEEIPMEQFRDLEDSEDIINKLKTKNRLTLSNASSIKLLSSNSFVAFEQTHDSIISQHGKIEERDINQILKTTFNNDEYLIVITSYLGFGHVFKYDEPHKKLQRLRNTGRLTFPVEEPLQVKGYDSSTVFLFAKSRQQAANKWIKYYTLDLKGNTFSNTRNCRIVDGEEDCKEIEPIKIISMRSRKSCPMPPFAKLITEITEGGITIHSELAPRDKMNESHLDAYDLWDTIPKYQNIDKEDFYSIVDFVLYSGLLFIDFDYTNPRDDGIIASSMGGCGFGYVIKTSMGEIELPITDSRIYNVPDLVSEFNGLYYGILEKYFDKNDYEPDFYLHIHLKQK